MTCLLPVLLLLSPAGAMATVFSGTINGDVAQATTCAISNSQSVGTVSFDDVTNVFSWSYTFGDNAPDFDDGNLTGAVTFAHFHGPAAPGMTANVKVGTGTANPNSGSVTIAASDGTDLLNELWYLNIHSDSCPSGEIRGQVLFPAPVPSLSMYGAALLVLSLLGATAYWRLQHSASVA